MHERKIEHSQRIHEIDYFIDKLLNTKTNTIHYATKYRQHVVRLFKHRIERRGFRAIIIKEYSDYSSIRVYDFNEKDYKGTILIRQHEDEARWMN